MKSTTMIAYIFSSILLIGLYYITFKNSPKHANILLVIVAISIGISFIQPREKSTLIGLALGIIGVFMVIIQSRNARNTTLQKWFTENGLSRIEFPSVETLFNPTSNDNIRYDSYKGGLTSHQKKIPFIMAIRYSSSHSGKLTRLMLDGSYYFKEDIDANVVEQKFKIAKENTPHTNLWKSNLRDFDIKDCQIVKPAMGGIVVSWQLPDALEGYGERYEWIKNALQN